MKKTFLKAAVLLCAGIGMTACGSGKQAVQAIDLTGEWNIVTVNGDTIKAENTPYLGLDMAEKRLYGNAGCNRMMGTFEADSLQPGKIKFGQIGTTRMMCPDMDTESKVAVLTLEKRETPAFTLNDLSGEWVITSVYGAQVGDMENTPFLAFDINQMRVHGNAGCNTINGGFSQEEGKENSLKFSQMISTMMACPDMDTERRILDALSKVAGFSLNEDQTVSLADSTGTAALTLVKNTGEPFTK